MKTTKEAVTALIAKLSNSHEFVNPVLIGDVLEKIYSMDDWGCGDALGRRNKILASWHLCDFTKSLQTIIKESGWGEVAIPKASSVEDVDIYEDSEQLEDPNARALIEFLMTIFK